MSRWLVVGAAGMLGQDLLTALGELPAEESVSSHEVTAVDRAELDITDPEACLKEVDGHDFVVNVAAWTAVDEAESHEAEAFAVNAVGAANLARACTAARAQMVQLSTDYVFAGDATSPYAEDAPLAPRSAPRPAYSVLGHDAWTRASLVGLRDWHEGLTEALPSVIPGS